MANSDGEHRAEIRRMTLERINSVIPYGFCVKYEWWTKAGKPARHPYALYANGKRKASYRTAEAAQDAAVRSNSNYTDAAGQKRLMAEAIGLPSDTYTRTIDTTNDGDYGSDPLGGGLFRMVHSGDIVGFEERGLRLGGK